MVINIPTTDIRIELPKILATKTNSCLRQRSLDDHDGFSWESLLAELKFHDF